jgi:photosystem II cytochrome c550
MLKSLHNFFFSILMRFSLFVTTASAIDLDEATRTVVADPAGKTIVLTEQVKRGKRLFNATWCMSLRWNYKNESKRWFRL